MGEQINQSVEFIYDLTPLQKGMLYHNMLDSKSTSYVLQNILKISGKINSDYMGLSLKLLSEKYETLRALILYRNVDIPKQVILKERPMEYKVTDFSLYNENMAELKFKEFAQEDIKRGFDLDKDTLIRVNIVYTEPDTTYMIITAHHICIDGWCLSFLLHDIIYFYEEYSNGMPVQSLEEEIAKEKRSIAPYRDYVKWIGEQEEEEGLLYWEKLLEGYDQSGIIEPIEIPHIKEETAGTESMFLNEAISNQIRAFVKKQEITLSLLFETAWAILLMKYNRTTDIVFGKVVSGRQKDLKGIEKAVGLYINTIPVRYMAKPETCILDLLADILEQEITSFHYDYCSLSDIQQRTMLQNELIQSIFVYENYYVQYDYDDDQIKFADYMCKVVSTREKTNYPLSLAAYEMNEDIKFSIMYDKNTYTEDNINRLCRQMKKIIETIIANPELTIDEIDLVTEEERDSILHRFNKQPAESTNNKTIVELFEEMVVKYNGNIVLQDSHRSITYAELNARSNQIAYKLLEFGIKPNDSVVIYGRKSIEVVCGIFGILKAGGCYVPIDADEASERLAYKLSDCKPKVVLVQNSDVEIGIEVPVFNLNSLEYKDACVENPPRIVSLDNLAYTIYTSGTTGKPKGVMIEHRSVANLCKNMIEEYDVRADDRMLQFASISFDASIWEISLATMNGAMLYIPDPNLSADINYIQEVIEREKITAMTLPPQFAGQLKPFKCRFILTAGSEASRELVQKITSYTNYINAYGPTEATICTSTWSCNKGEEIPLKIPIGIPQRNFTIYILDKSKLCGIGVPGELAIGGSGLSRGYLNQSELTEQKFIDNPYGEGKLYLTGDLARWLPDGNIEYLGRLDEQVKIRGYRIELTEVEGAIWKLPDIRDCAVIAIKNNYGDLCIAAYLVSDHKLILSSIRQSLAEYLPNYMIPDYITQITSIPVTINGKIDKKKLSKETMINNAIYEPPQNELERKICGVYSQLLGIEKIGVNDKFMENGGNSINAMRLIVLLSKEDIQITISETITLQTPKRISEFILEREAKERIRKLEQEEKDSKIAMVSNKESDLSKSEYDSKLLDEDRIRDTFVDQIRFDSYCVEREYPVLTRQKLFLTSNYNIVCNSKVSITGVYSREHIEMAIKGMIKHQSVFRSCFSDSYDTIMEMQYTGQVSIPYFDLSRFHSEEREYFLSMIEEIGCEVSRFVCMVPLAQQCLVKISEDMHIIYLFAHHAVCDMISAHIWSLEMLEHIYDHNKLIEEYRYFDYVPKEKSVDKQKSSVTELDSVPYLNMFEKIDNDMELSVICRDTDIYRKIELSPVNYAIRLLEGIIHIYHEDYSGKIPFLFVHHGRNDKNRRVMGLFIDLFQFQYEYQDTEAINVISKMITDMNISDEYTNIMNEESYDFSKVIYYPLINIVIDNKAYIPHPSHKLQAEDGHHTSEIEFKGITIEFQFYNNAVRLLIKCNRDHKDSIVELCLNELGRDCIVE